MSQPGAYSLAEITTQGESWQGAIAATLAQLSALLGLLGRAAGRRILFIGCGSTHYLAQFAAPWFQAVTGCACRALPSSELLLQTDTLLAADEAPLVIALSRSGETSETILAMEKLRARGSEALTISCYDDTPLSRASTLTIGIPEGREASFAQTRSFAGMLVAVQTLGALVAGDDALLAELQRLPGLASALIARAAPVAQALGQDETIQRITYLGSGALIGLAGEAMIKIKEMSLSAAEAFHFMEFRHGPMALVDGAHLVVGLLSDAVRPYELGVLRDVQARGSRLAILGEHVTHAGGADALFELGSGVSERARGVLYLPFLQLLAYHRAIGRGLDPDRPRNVVMAIRLSGAEMVS